MGSNPYTRPFKLKVGHSSEQAHNSTFILASSKLVHRLLECEGVPQPCDVYAGEGWLARSMVGGGYIPEPYDLRQHEDSYLNVECF